MEPIIDYDVVAGGDPASVVMQVREFIRKGVGWEPQGGLYTYEDGLFYQVIVKRDKPPEYLRDLNLKLNTDALGLLERWRIEEAMEKDQ